MMMERILLIAERYVTETEKLHTEARTILPHGALFWGSPVTVCVTCDSPKSAFTLTVRTVF